MHHIAVQWLLAAAVAAFSAAPGAVAAETSRAQAAPPQPPPAPTSPAQGPPVQALQAPPPYELQLLRLSERMGALHYLRGLCGFDDAPAWRDKMNALMAAQGLDDAGKARFAGAFNRGFRTFSETYRSCSDAATAVIRAYLDESAAITKELESRYGH